MSEDSIKRRERVTIKSVAADAGVSVAAVSKVLRNAYGVSPAMRSDVMASIKKLGYRPNVAARGLRGQTYTIGILLNDLLNPFLSDIVDGVNATLATEGYKALIGVGQENEPITAGLIDSMIDFRMDGLIFIAPLMGKDLLSTYAPQIPFVCVAHHNPDVTSYDTVNSDDIAGTRLVIADMIAAGYRDIAMLSLDQPHDPESSVSGQREKSYLATMAQAGLSDYCRIFRYDSVLISDPIDFSALLQSPNRPRAIFCWSDLHAVPLLNQASELGLRAPEDIAVAGFDNSRTAALPLISLTSVDQGGRQLGQAAAELLISRIKGRRQAKHITVAPRLVRRGSM